jgi:serine/threonine protein kinase
MGTINYMSPEQALGQEVDRRTDIFSLGVVLYELVTGSQPFKGNSDAAVYDAILNRAPTSVTSSNPALPADLNRIISRALEKDRELRYQTASDLRAELKRLERDSGSGQVAIANKEETETTHPASSAEYLVTGIKRHKLSALLAFGLVLVLIAASYLWLRSRVSIKETSPSIENATTSPARNSSPVYRLTATHFS